MTSQRTRPNPGPNRDGNCLPLAEFGQGKRAGYRERPLRLRHGPTPPVFGACTRPTTPEFKRMVLPQLLHVTITTDMLPAGARALLPGSARISAVESVTLHRRRFRR